MSDHEHPLSGSRSPGGLSSSSDFDRDTEAIVRPVSLPAGCWTLLPIVDRCDNARLPQGPFGPDATVRVPPQRAAGARAGSSQQVERLVPFYVKQDDVQPIGFLRPAVLAALLADNEGAVKRRNAQPCWIIQSTSEDAEDLDNIHGVAFADWVNEDGKEGRHDQMDRLVRGWKEDGLFAGELKGWRNEQYPIYGPNLSQDDPDYSPLPGSNTAFTLERAACALFGFSTYGVHLTAFVKRDYEYLFWVPRRAATKQTWPGCLDNSVAGGITAGDNPWETIVRECAEEASLPPAFVRRRIRAAGMASYIFRSDDGWLQPETQYVYDLEMSLPPLAFFEDPATFASEQASASEPVVLRPNDGEAESFALMPADEVLDKMVLGEFKPNCALVLVDFFVRHGLLTSETDAKYLEICQRLRGSLAPLPGPG